MDIRFEIAETVRSQPIAVTATSAFSNLAPTTDRR
jgi:hypothetical protein